MADADGDVAVTHNEAQSRFEVWVDEKLAEATYTRSGGTITLNHTSVPPSERGEGVGEALARAAFEFARAENLQVVPACQFMRAYAERHPEYQDRVRS